MLDKIKSILSQYSGIDPEQISAESNLKADLELNSLDLVESVVAFEEAFGVDISDREIAELQTVGDIVKLLSEPQ